MSRLSNKELHEQVVATFKADRMKGTPIHTVIDRCEELLIAPPMFNEQQLAWFGALLTVSKGDVPTAAGYDVAMLTAYAESLGRHEGMMDILSYITTTVEQNQINPIDPAQE